MGKDIVASLEIVPDPRVENGFAIDRLIAKTGAPRLEKVHADGGAKDRAFVRTKKILKRARGAIRFFERHGSRGCGRWRVRGNGNTTNVFGAK